MVEHDRALAIGREIAEAQNRLADALMALERPEAAIKHYEKTLAIDPRHAEAHNNLGVALHKLGRLDEAVGHYEQALAIKPDLAQAHGGLGNALRALDRPEQAIAEYRKALAIAPDHADDHNNLAGVLQMLGRAPEAIAHLERAILLKPGYAEAHFNLGNALHAVDRHDEAIAQYEKALLIRPDFAGAHNNIGNALQKLGRFDEAIMRYERALAIKPDYVEVHRNIGNALLSLSRYEEAIAQFEKTLAVIPSKAEAHNNIGAALEALGKFEEAYRAYQRAAELAPGKATILLNLAAQKRFTVGDARLGVLEKLAEDVASLEPEDRVALHFALGKAYGDLDRREPSFRHLLTGNALKRRLVPYDEAETLGTFERIRAVFTAELMEAKRDCGEPTSVPVFVVGMPRSGTTLVEQILASHSAIFGAGELVEFRKAVGSFEGANRASSYPELVLTMSGDELRRLGATYVGRIRPAAPAAERIVDKMPANFLYAGLIHLALPHARIIHVRRDPVDTCLSCFSLLFTGEQPHTYDLAELGRYYGAYVALMAHWRNVLPDGVMLEVKYEDVVDDLEGQARRIVAYCGLEWQDSCLAFYKTQRPVNTASAAQVRRPIYRSSVGRWRPYGPLLNPLLEVLGIARLDDKAS